MDFNTLRYNLQLPYNQNDWKDWLLQLFGQQISFESLAEKISIQKGSAKSIERYASIVLSDNKNIAVLDIVTTKDVQIARNRVALRDIAFKLIDQDKYHGLLVFYHSEDISQLDYRLSFISSQTIIDEDGIILQQSTNTKRYSFVLGANESCTTATNRLLDLKNKIPKFKAFELQKGISLKDVTDAFSVEALNNEFFKKYKDIHYKRFWEYIANKPEYAALLLNTEETEIAKKQKPIRDFVKKMLGRIVFLHFLQKKGWMGCPTTSNNWTGGDKMFMLNLFENSTDKENFYSNTLTTLFYDTLNKKRNGDIAPFKVQNSLFKIPFLNGGLFDDDAPETNNFNFPVEYFKDLFDFFSQYNFTIDENSPEEQEVGIDPEMLGHIFENLLEENKDKGAFYTPKEIVHYMCQESLIQYLRTHLPECTEDESQATKAIENFIRKDDIGNRTDKKNFLVASAKRIEAILDKVKICDPAIGSGAFPMGMLQEIFKAKITLDLTLDKAQVKKEIIQNSIYGVDIEKGAVDIARLRFWLSLVVDEDVPQPLPNLDYKIMQGNSLLESFEDVDLSTLLKEDDTNEPILYANNEQIKLFDDVKQTLIVFDKADKQDLQNLINLYFDFEENTKTKYKNKQDIKQAINKIIEGKLKAHFYLQKSKYEADKNEVEIGITANAIKPTDPKGIVDKKTKNLVLVNKKLEAIDYKINHLTDILHKLNKWETEDKERPYFLWHTYFKDVFDKGGFDIVIGNPPYISIENLNPGLKKSLFEKFDTCTGRTDIYIAFIEGMLQILKKNAVLTYIIPYPYTNQNYGSLSRKILIEKYFIKEIMNNSEYYVFESATVKNIILKVLNSKSTSDTLIRTAKSQMNFQQNKFEDYRINQTKFLELKDFRFETKNIESASKLKYKIWKNSIRLDQICLIAYGARLNHKTKAIGKENYIHKEFKDGYKPFTEGKKIDRYTFNQYGWLDYKPNEHYNSMFTELFENEKIFFINVVKDRLRFAYDSEHFYNSHTVINVLKWNSLQNAKHITVKRNISNEKIHLADNFSYKFILGILNSQLMSWYFNNFLSESLHFYPDDAKELPILNLLKEKQKDIESLVDKILSLKSTNNSSIYYENKIDALVFHLYGLTEAEMNQVLLTFKDLDTKDRTQIVNEYKNINNNKFRLEI
jgi:hypothetical protein